MLCPHVPVKQINDAIAHLRSGGLVVYPTETAYAFGCDATNREAVRAVFARKRREHGKALPVIVASRVMAKRYATWTKTADQIAREHWPGPLTIIAQYVRPNDSDGLAPGVIARDGTVAMRVSSHPIAMQLVRRLGRPIVSTSANRAGEPTCFSVACACRWLDCESGDVYVLDIGSLPKRKPSTIVDGVVEPLRVRREGRIQI